MTPGKYNSSLKNFKVLLILWQIRKFRSVKVSSEFTWYFTVCEVSTGMSSKGMSRSPVSPYPWSEPMFCHRSSRGTTRLNLYWKTGHGLYWKTGHLNCNLTINSAIWGEKTNKLPGPAEGREPTRDATTSAQTWGHGTSFISILR